MADPKEMRKGGFGAFAAIHRERREARPAAARQAREQPSAEPAAGPAERALSESRPAAASERPRRVRADKTTVLPPDAGGTGPRHR